MEDKYKKILKSYYINNEIQDSKYTHVSLIQPRGRYFVKNDQDHFWKLYCDIVHDTRNPILGLAECINKKENKDDVYLPILVDIDIKIKIEECKSSLENKLYKNESVHKVVKIYQNILKNIIYGIDDEQYFSCVVLEKNPYKVNKNGVEYVKNGFHLHFPYIFLSIVNHETHLIPRVKEELKKSNIFNYLGIVDSSETFDNGYCRAPWLMYGSRKSEDMDPYTFSKIIDIEGNEIYDLEEGLRGYKIYQNYNLIETKGKMKYLLPKILSIYVDNREVFEIKKDVVPYKTILNREKHQNEMKMEISENVDILLEDCRELLSMLKPYRCSDRNEWINIGWVLYNVGNGSEKAFDIWCEFSARDVSFEKSVCIYEWSKMSIRGYSIGTLRWMAKHDNITEYKKFQHKKADEYIQESVSGSHNDIAKVMYEFYGEEFVCSSIQNKKWWYYSDGHWKEIDSGIYLRERISIDMSKIYTELGSKIWTKMDNPSLDKEINMIYKKKFDKLSKMRCNVKSAPFKDSVMKECREVFYKSDFETLLNKDPMLIGFKNGVYDLKNNKFRKAKPEDYISKRLQINYREFNDTDNDVLDICNFLEKIFPDAELRKYFLEIASDVFVGGNKDKSVYFWTGDGDNGKSVTQTLFERMLGPLAIKFSTTLITGKKTSIGCANPELARSGEGVRWATMEEPDGDEHINVGILKALTGNDSFFARDLFEKGKSTKEITPYFKLVFICNKLPNIKYADKATWNRIKVIPFESTFVRHGDKCPETYAEQLKEKRFPMDKNFYFKIPNMLEPFAWFLLNYRIKMMDEEYIQASPYKVINATSKYRSKNDYLSEFIQDNIILDENELVSITDIFSVFKDWFRENHPNMNIPSKNELKDYLLDKWGEFEKRNKWKGYRIRNFNDE
jgi:P4 family phage/plasmid primase-like protien